MALERREDLLILGTGEMISSGLSERTPTFLLPTEFIEAVANRLSGVGTSISMMSIGRSVADDEFEGEFELVLSVTMCCGAVALGR